MSAETRRQADGRLAAALGEAAAADLREDFRDRLRRLKRDNAAEFRRMTEHYEQVVLPELLASPDPLRVWIDFGVTLGGTSGPGKVAAVDGTGRSSRWAGEYAAGELLLWLPEDRQADALPLLVPAEPTPAQEAALDLLVRKKLSL